MLLIMIWITGCANLPQNLKQARPTLQKQIIDIMALHSYDYILKYSQEHPKQDIGITTKGVVRMLKGACGKGLSIDIAFDAAIMKYKEYKGWVSLLKKEFNYEFTKKHFKIENQEVLCQFVGALSLRLDGV